MSAIPCISLIANLEDIYFIELGMSFEVPCKDMHLLQGYKNYLKALETIEMMREKQILRYCWQRQAGMHDWQ